MAKTNPWGSQLDLFRNIGVMRQPMASSSRSEISPIRTTVRISVDPDCQLLVLRFGTTFLPEDSGARVESLESAEEEVAQEVF